MVDAISFAGLFYLLEIPLMLARIAFVLSSTFTWYGNRVLTFASTDHPQDQTVADLYGRSKFLGAAQFLVFKLCTLAGSEGLPVMLALMAGIRTGRQQLPDQSESGISSARKQKKPQQNCGARQKGMRSTTIRCCLATSYNYCTIVQYHLLRYRTISDRPATAQIALPSPW